MSVLEDPQFLQLVSTIFTSIFGYIVGRKTKK